jgi:hypothetical protein
MHLLPKLKKLADSSWARISASRTPILLVAAVIIVAWIPLYRILFPPLVDLPEHLLISKLLWEKLAGVSHLDLQISWFLGYRLIPIVLLGAISFFKVFGISLVLLPRIVALGLMGFHAVVVLVLLYSKLRNKTWWGWLLATALALPAVICMYSACWFIGFINYTLAITLLLPAIFLAERFLGERRVRDAALLFLNLVLLYTAHPFGPIFWILWLGSRALAAFATGTIFAEWKRLLLLLAVVVPIFVYHFPATRNTALAPSNQSLLAQSPVLPVREWYENRVTNVISGAWLKADDAADARTFSRFALLFIGAATVAAFSRGSRRAGNVMLSSIFLLFGASWVNEKFIPVPAGAWLAYDYRFVSTTYAVGLALAGLVLIRSIPVTSNRRSYSALLALLALLSILACSVHLIDVRRAYVRNDRQARKYMAKVFRQESPAGIHIPHSRWHPDGTLIRLYACLEQPDCNPEGTTFHTGYVSDLYPVKFRSRTRVLSAREEAVWRRRPPVGPLVGHWKFDEPNRSDPCMDSSGNGHKGIAVGTAVVEGKFQKARSFSGLGEYIEIPPINLPEAITVSAWVYSDRFMQNGFVVAKNPVNGQWSLFFEGGHLKWRTVGVSNSVTCPGPVNGAWHHILARQEGSNAALYVDGQQCVSGTLPPIGNAPTSISIGRFDSPGFSYFNGRIDDVRLYNRALSDAEVAELYAAGNSGTVGSVP